MLIISLSAAMVGLVHSLAPGHWLPVILMAKSRRWDLKTAMFGAMVAASGHVLLSIILGLVSIWIGAQIFAPYEDEIERYAGIALSVFGLIYALVAYKRHHKCHGHTHHGPNPKGQRAPFLFLFSLGFSPCVAVLPVIVTASTEGSMGVLLACVSFSIGVLTALVGSTLVVTLGLLKLDHPVFEHYGDVITGCGVAIMGLLLFFFGHGHHHHL